jgi:hypothetical protein
MLWLLKHPYYIPFIIFNVWIIYRIIKMVINEEDQDNGDDRGDEDDDGGVDVNDDPDLDLPPGVSLPRDTPELQEV